MFRRWGCPPVPPSVRCIFLLGAALKAGRYRAAESYLSAYKMACIRLGYEITQEHQAAMRDAVRSCTRGIGAPTKAAAIPFERLSQLPAGRHAWVPGGPLSPRNALTAGSWWLLREIEVSTVRARLAEVSWSGDLLVVHITLPASKTDQRASGVSRGHRCRCAGAEYNVGCPAHVVLDQLLFLRRQFPARWRGGLPDWDLPLFPNFQGLSCSKEAVVATLQAAASKLEVPLSSADGSSRISGHTLRVSGARGLARLGFPLWSVQLLGRWGSDAVKGYIGEAALDIFTTQGGVRIMGASLEELLERSSSAVGHVSSLPSIQVVGRIEEAIRIHCGQLRRELQCALQDEVARALAARGLLSSSNVARGSADDPAPSETSWVVNTASGVYHRIAVGPASGLSAAWWSACCGWKFGRSNDYCFVPPQNSSPKNSTNVCHGKCSVG